VNPFEKIQPAHFGHVNVEDQTVAFTDAAGGEESRHEPNTRASKPAHSSRSRSESRALSSSSTMKIIGCNLTTHGLIVPSRTHRALIWVSRLDKNRARLTPTCRHASAAVFVNTHVDG